MFRTAAGKSVCISKVRNISKLIPSSRLVAFFSFWVWCLMKMHVVKQFSCFLKLLFSFCLIHRNVSVWRLSSICVLGWVAQSRTKLAWLSQTCRRSTRSWRNYRCQMMSLHSQTLQVSQPAFLLKTTTGLKPGRPRSARRDGYGSTRTVDTENLGRRQQLSVALPPPLLLGWHG